jgi:hypothetical protein
MQQNLYLPFVSFLSHLSVIEHLEQLQLHDDDLLFFDRRTIQTNAAMKIRATMPYCI